MGDSLVFYCKDCDKMFYASVNEPGSWDEEGAEEVALLLKQGHRLATVDATTVRREFGGCDCKDQG